MNDSAAVPEKVASSSKRPLLLTILAILLGIAAVVAVGYAVWYASQPDPELPEGGGEQAPSYIGDAWVIVAGLIGGGLLSLIAYGMWRSQSWARLLLILMLVGVVGAFWMQIMFVSLAAVFEGDEGQTFVQILQVLGMALLRALAIALIPGAIIYALVKLEWAFTEPPAQRRVVDRGVRYVLLSSALLSIIIVFLILLFTLRESMEAITGVGVGTMVFGTVWRPGSIIGVEGAQYGMFPIIVGSILSTFGAAMLGVPLSLGAAILLAEIAPPAVREIFRPAIELLAGIPSVVFGLFGMVVLAPVIRWLWKDVPYNTGFGLLNASVILAIMIIPTITNIAEDSIRAVPRRYKEGSLALGGTRWQTIYKVALPAARSGIVASIILGIGRALGETMAMIMVIGNSIAIPEPLAEGNPLTIFLSSARTLTGNIAVEINYATGAHRSALFFSGVLLLLMILVINSIARAVMRAGQAA